MLTCVDKKNASCRFDMTHCACRVRVCVVTCRRNVAIVAYVRNANVAIVHARVVRRTRRVSFRLFVCVDQQRMRKIDFVHVAFVVEHVQTQIVDVVSHDLFARRHVRHMQFDDCVIAIA